MAIHFSAYNSKGRLTDKHCSFKKQCVKLTNDYYIWQRIQNRYLKVNYVHTWAYFIFFHFLSSCVWYKTSALFRYTPFVVDQDCLMAADLGPVQRSSLKDYRSVIFTWNLLPYIITLSTAMALDCGSMKTQPVSGPVLVWCSTASDLVSIGEMAMGWTLELGLKFKPKEQLWHISGTSLSK